MHVELAHEVLHTRIPNYQSPEGPYFELIDEIRANAHVKGFRQKIEQLYEEGSGITVLGSELDSEFDTLRNKALLEKAGAGSIYESTGSISIGIGSEVIRSIPLLGTLIGIGFDVKDIVSTLRYRKRYGWAAFLANVEEKSSKHHA